MGWDGSLTDFGSKTDIKLILALIKFTHFIISFDYPSLSIWNFFYKFVIFKLKKLSKLEETILEDID